MAGASAGVGVEVVGLEKAFPLRGREVRVLQGLSLSIPPGGFLAVAGRSGCGKTTLLRLLAGLEEPDAGEIRFLRGGAEVPRERIRVGFVFQEPRLMPWLTVEANLAFGLEETLPREEIRARVDRILGLVGLRDFRDAYTRQISGGMAQRAALTWCSWTSPSAPWTGSPAATSGGSWSTCMPARAGPFSWSPTTWRRPWPWGIRCSSFGREASGGGRRFPFPIPGIQRIPGSSP